MPKPEKKPQPTGNPGVRVKDHVYFRHGADVRHGHVRACGEHGATINADGETHRVTWDRVMGHKKRAEIKVKVVDQGEDGAIVEDDKGNRFYLKSADEGGGEKDEPMHKSMKAGAVVALFIKALAPGRTGLTLKDTHDQTGHSVKRWMKNGEDPAAEEKPGGQE